VVIDKDFNKHLTQKVADFGGIKIPNALLLSCTNRSCFNKQNTVKTLGFVGVN